MFVFHILYRLLSWWRYLFITIINYYNTIGSICHKCVAQNDEYFPHTKRIVLSVQFYDVLYSFVMLVEGSTATGFRGLCQFARFGLPVWSCFVLVCWFCAQRFITIRGQMCVCGSPAVILFYTILIYFIYCWMRGQNYIYEWM